MRSLILILSFFIVLAHICAAGAVAGTSSENADAVVVLDELEFHIKNINSAVLNIHRKVEVLREKGKEFGRFSVTENRYAKCKKISARILDLDGKELKELKKDDILKANVSPGNTIYDDNKYQLVEFAWPKLPYILEYEYEVEFNTVFMWPDWFPQEDVPVEKSVYRLMLDEPVNYYTHQRGIEISPDVMKKGKKQTLTWTLENLEPRLKEDWMPPEDRHQKYLLFTPAEFQLDGYKGYSDTWAHFGEWDRRLANGRYQLTPELLNTVRELTADCLTDHEKIGKLYSFLQNYTRYVSISLGIGGWQPNSAESVCVNKYGDCKDLTTFMVAMANSAGIPAYPALVKTRDKGVLFHDFPSNQFNHVIAFVPLPDDTMWLECTADYLAAGDLPPDDEGCFVLVINEKNGEIMRTPAKSAEKNTVSSSITGDLTSDGELQFTGQVKFTGNNAFSRRAGLLTDERKDLRQIFSTGFLAKYLSSPSLQRCDFENLKDNFDLPLICDFDGTVRKYAVSSARRIFFNPALLHRETASDLPAEEEREFAVNYYFPYSTIDTVRINLPPGYDLEAAPEPLELSTPFGKYRTSYEIRENQLTFVREEAIYNKQIQPEDYAAYRSFMKAVIKNDKANFVLNWM